MDKKFSGVSANSLDIKWCRCYLFSRRCALLESYKNSVPLGRHFNCIRIQIAHFFDKQKPVRAKWKFIFEFHGEAIFFMWIHFRSIQWLVRYISVDLTDATQRIAIFFFASRFLKLYMHSSIIGYMKRKLKANVFEDFLLLWRRSHDHMK